MNKAWQLILGGYSILTGLSFCGFSIAEARDGGAIGLCILLFLLGAIVILGGIVILRWEKQSLHDTPFE